MKKITLHSLMLIVGLFLDGCKEEPKPRLTTIDGVVIDIATFKPLSDFPIGVGGSTGNTFSGTNKFIEYTRLLTDSSGRFSFSKEILPAYTLTVYSLGGNSKIGLYDITDCPNQCIVFPGETVSLTLKMKKL